MPSLKEVKQRIQSVSSTQQITKAMKMVAAAKLRRAQDRIVQLRPYSEKLASLLANVSSGNTEDGMNTYSEQREVKRVLVVPITSDRGLCGAFNSNILKAVRRLVESDELQGKAIEILPIGKKSYDNFRKRDYPMVNQFWGVFGDLTFDNVREAAEYAMDSYVAGKYDKVYLVYNEFKNVATQIVQTQQFLPVLEVEKTEEVNTNTDYMA